MQSLSLDLVNKATTSLTQNRTMKKLHLHRSEGDKAQKADVSLFLHHLLLGLSSNTTLTDLSLELAPQDWARAQGELILKRMSVFGT